MAAVLTAVEAEIKRLPEAAQVSWGAEVARTLAAQLDAEPNAAMARELRSMMTVLMAGNSREVEVDAVDEIAAARDRRRASSS